MFFCTRCTQAVPTALNFFTKVHSHADEITEKITLALKSPLLAEQAKLHDSVSKLTSRVNDLYTQNDQLANRIETLRQEVPNSDGPGDTHPSRQINTDNPATAPPQTTVDMVDELLSRERRKKNLVVFNIPEAPGPSVSEDCRIFTDICRSELGLTVKVITARRLGKQLNNKPRLLLITLENEAPRWEILRAARKLKDSTKYGSVFINPDLSRKERDDNRQLRTELKRRRSLGERNLRIYRGEIINTAGPQNKNGSTSGAETTSHSASQPSIPISAPNLPSLTETAMEATQP